jgi:cell division protein FtsI (penicillin-binding protein 3)
MNTTRLRYWSIIALLGVFALVVLVRYATLAASKTTPASAAPVEGDRGTISDRNGRPLAMDSPLYNIALWRPETDRGAFPEEAQRLASLLGLEASDVIAKWEKGTSDFFYLKKRVQPKLARAVQEAKAEGGFSGVVVEKVAGRLYPEKRLASHLVGFVGDGNRGLYGVEGKYEKDLAPLAVGDAAARDGNSIVLSIDADLQFSLEAVARRALLETQATAVMLLAADVRTGEILAYVAMPDFDPNEYILSPQETWYDWLSVYRYEPGSVFKVFSMAAVLDLGGADMGTLFLCDGSYHRVTPLGEKISIKCLGIHGSVSIEEILALSCNSGAGEASDRVQSLDFYEKLRAFGFGSRSGAALMGENPGELRSPETWSLRSKPTIAMGQELFVTAVQMTAAASAIANGGVLQKPIVVLRLVGPDGKTVFENAPQPVRRVISAETARSILGAMEVGSSDFGTGKRAKVRDVRMAVKTGTAQIFDSEKRRYSDKDFLASTLAIFPVEDPRVALYLAIVKPKGESYYGGRIAAPVIKDAAEAVLTLTDIPRADSPEFLHSGSIRIPRVEQAQIGETMPDLRGTPKRLLVNLLGRSDIRIHIEGDGYVVRQSPAPGTTIKAGAVITLELK